MEKPLRNGFTTGTCAAAAAKAAAAMLVSGKIKTQVTIMTPKGTVAEFTLLEVTVSLQGVACGVRKDAGDDPDVTHGVMVYAEVHYIEGLEDGVVPETWYQPESEQSERFERIYLTGGAGIGMVTLPGLSCPVGKPAINPVPRQMIFKEVGAVIPEGLRREGLLIKISIPDGVVLAEKTFNPNLGIRGGISVLGTSGIVEPMSEHALLETIRLEIHMKAVEGLQTLILTPGNYGETFLRERLRISLHHGVKCSNFIAAAMEFAAKEGIRQVLLVGHIGKLIKVAGGVGNTHSKYGDRRMEIMADCAGEAAGGWNVKNDALREKLLGSNTTEQALGYLKEHGCLAEALQCVADRVREHILIWTQGVVAIEVVTFSTRYDILGMTKGAKDQINRSGGWIER